jgi:hypothetical protein
MTPSMLLKQPGDQPPCYEGTDAWEALIASTYSVLYLISSIKEDIALSVEQFNGQTCGPGLYDNFVV